MAQGTDSGSSLDYIPLPRLPSEAANSRRSAVVARTGSLQFARARIAPEPREVSAPLHLQLHLANGRLADLLLSDEWQLPRVLALLEEPV
jgi:hypothetical protein